MNGAYVHLLFNHVPVIGIPLVALLLLTGILRKNSEVLRIAFAGFILIAALTIPAYKSGGPAARLIRDLPQVSMHDIQEHAEDATWGFRAVMLLGGMGIVGFWLTKKPTAISRGFTVATLVTALLVSAWLANVAHLGGLIRHPEIQQESNTGKQ